MSGEVDKWSVEQCRDWLAENAEPWTRKGDRWYHEKWHRTGSGQKRHPIPATLDAAAHAMPEVGYFEIRNGGGDQEPWICAVSLAEFDDPVLTFGKTRLECEFRAAVKARMAGGGGAVKA